MLHTPRRPVAHAELPHELQRGDTILGLGNKKHREEPSRQRQLGIGKDCPAGERRLVMAAITLIQSISVEEAMMSVAALWTNKTAWPAPIE